MKNTFGEPAPQLGPSKTWSVGPCKLMHYGNRLSKRWGFQVGALGSEADNPFVAAYRALKQKRRYDAAVKARQSRSGLTPEQTEEIIRKLNDDSIR